MKEIVVDQKFLRGRIRTPDVCVCGMRFVRENTILVRGKQGKKTIRFLYMPKEDFLMEVSNKERKKIGAGATASDIFDRRFRQTRIDRSKDEKSCV